MTNLLAYNVVTQRDVSKLGLRLLSVWLHAAEDPDLSCRRTFTDGNELIRHFHCFLTCASLMTVGLTQHTLALFYTLRVLSVSQRGSAVRSCEQQILWTRKISPDTDARATEAVLHASSCEC